MMKADVLSGFDTIKVCHAYRYRGAEITHFPYTLEDDAATPLYTEFKGWKQDLTGMTEEGDLPEELMAYVQYLEQALEVPITMVSVGPDRTQTIVSG